MVSPGKSQAVQKDRIAGSGGRAVPSPDNLPGKSAAA